MQPNKFFDEVDSFLKQRVCDLPVDEEERLETINAEVNGHIVSRARPFSDMSVKYLQIFDAIDQKASGLLTHISVMIAVNVFLLGTPTHPLLDIASVALLVGFIAAALLVLRLLRFWTTGFPNAYQKPDGTWETEIDGLSLIDEMETSFKLEVFYRARLYRSSLNLTTLLTLLSAILIVIYGVALALSRPDAVVY